MRKQKEQVVDIGLSQENPEKQSSPESPQKRIRPKKTKAESTNQSPSTTGSTSETPRNSGASDSENGTGPIQSKDRSPLQPEPMPVPSPIVDRKVEALRRLKVKSEQLETAPPITPLLKDAFGGLPTVMEAMRFASNDEVIAAFLKKYDLIPLGDREVLPWEAICISAGVNLNHFAGSAMLATTTYCANKSKLIAITNHPEITKKRVEYGLLPSGEKDRNALDILVGAVQSPRGPTFIGKAVFGAAGGSAKTKDDDEPADETGVFGMDDDLDELFPPSNAMQDKLVPIRQRLLDK